MAGLSEAVQSEIAAQGLPGPPGANTPLASDFEQWLNYLVEAAPWLDESDQLRNRAAFADIARAIHQVLTVGQLHAVIESDEPPAWLAQLVRYWDATEAVVLTFNYDVLIELAWLTLHGDRSWSDLYPVPLTPAAARQVGIVGGEQGRPGMSLLKLHGSLNWHYSGPGSPPGDTVFDVGVRGPWSAEGTGTRWPEYGERMVVDKVPMIVPPAAVKSPYYGNQIIRALWQQAASALRSADELVLMGFSLPPSDQLVAALIATELPPAATIIPVDRDRAIIDNLRGRLSIGEDDNRVVESFCGPDEPLKRWVETCANFE